MKKQKNTIKNPYKYIWPLGFTGFAGLTYFINHEPKTLFFFTLFIFFGYYFTGKIADEKQDERMRENGTKAWIMASRIPFLLLLLMPLVAFYFPVTIEFFTAISSVGFSLTVIAHQGMFYYYERYT